MTKGQNGVKVKKGRNKLDQERLEKKQQAEGQEYLDTITQPDEAKGAAAVIEAQDKAEYLAAEDKFKKIEEMEKSRRFKKADYIRKLAEIMNEKAEFIVFPPGYRYLIRYNEEKLHIVIITPDGRRFGRGIIPTGSTIYDFNAVEVLLTQAENTIDKIEERGEFKKKDEIIVPK